MKIKPLWKNRELYSIYEISFIACLEEPLNRNKIKNTPQIVINICREIWLNVKNKGKIKPDTKFNEVYLAPIFSKQEACDIIDKLGVENFLKDCPKPESKANPKQGSVSEINGDWKKPDETVTENIKECDDIQILRQVVKSQAAMITDINRQRLQKHIDWMNDNKEALDAFESLEIKNNEFKRVKQEFVQEKQKYDHIKKSYAINSDLLGVEYQSLKQSQPNNKQGSMFAIDGDRKKLDEAVTESFKSRNEHFTYLRKIGTVDLTPMIKGDVISLNFANLDTIYNAVMKTNHPLWNNQKLSKNSNPRQITKNAFDSEFLRPYLKDVLKLNREQGRGDKRKKVR